MLSVLPKASLKDTAFMELAEERLRDLSAGHLPESSCPSFWPQNQNSPFLRDRP
jgi:hypothetical protein